MRVFMPETFFSTSFASSSSRISSCESTAAHGEKEKKTGECGGRERRCGAAKKECHAAPGCSPVSIRRLGRGPPSQRLHLPAAARSPPRAKKVVRRLAAASHLVWRRRLVVGH